jgi:hypothetical protein
LPLFKRKHSESEPVVPADPAGDPLVGLKAQIEQSVEHFRASDLTRAKYRQIIVERGEATRRAQAAARTPWRSNPNEDPLVPRERYSFGLSRERL